MKVHASEINKEVIKRLRKRRGYESLTNRDGMLVMNAITRVVMKTLKKGKLLSFGAFWLYPEKKGVFRRRNMRSILARNIKSMIPIN